VLIRPDLCFYVEIYIFDQLQKPCLMVIKLDYDSIYIGYVLSSSKAGAVMILIVW